MNSTPRLLSFIIVSATLFLSTASAQSSETTSGFSTALPQFEDYPAVIFTGKPAPVNLTSHPDARRFRTRLTEKPETDTRFAGHYRVVEFGCGSSCQMIWIVDLIDGKVLPLSDAMYGTGYRADSRLIVTNDPAYFDDMLKDTELEDPVAEVEFMLQSFGLPTYWLEEQGKFKSIGPDKMHVDPVSKKIVAN